MDRLRFMLRYPGRTTRILKCDVILTMQKKIMQAAGNQYYNKSFYNGGYRYFFNGQEADNKAYVERDSLSIVILT